MSAPGWFDVAGGKLTTYRLIAEQTVDQVLGHLGRGRIACRTAVEPLLPEDEARGTSAIVPPEPRPELVEHFCRREWAVHLDDVMTRRTGWRYYLDRPADAARQVAEWMAAIFGWSAARQEAELAEYLAAPT